MSACCFSQQADFHCAKPVHKFPKTNEGAILEHDFIIENKGKSPLIISAYQVACTCTKVYLPKEPILPGQSVSIKIVFDTAGKQFFQDRMILLTTNSKQKEEKLRFKVYVIPKQP